MFDTLMESRAIVVDRRRRWTAASAGIHAAIITAVAVATIPGEPVTDDAPSPVHILRWIAPVPAPISETPSMPTTGRFSLSVPEVRVPRIPSLDGSVDFDPRPISAREIFKEGIVLSSSPGPGPSLGTVLTADRVDRQVVPRSGNGQPAYPENLRAASVEGEVIARFVVDTIGLVEPLSITILASTHSLFAAAVTKWLTRTAYVPAEAGGRAVRQLVEQRFQFALRK